MRRIALIADPKMTKDLITQNKKSMKDVKIEFTGTAEEIAKILALVGGGAKAAGKKKKPEPEDEEEEDEDEPEEDEEDAEEEEDEEEGVTMDVLRKAVLAKSKKSPAIKAKIVALLGKYNVEKVTELPEAKWEKFNAALEKIK